MRYFKCGMLGFTGGGKTHTAAILAAEIVRRFGGKTGKVFLYDTENSAFQVQRILRAAGVAMDAPERGRSLAGLMAYLKKASVGKNNVLIADSITHVWRELCNSYMAQLNAARDAAGRPKLSRMGLPQIMKLKEYWAPWADQFLNASAHIVICGRAGWEWDEREDEDTGQQVLTKTGIKMKVEGEFGFEPDVIFELARDQVEDGRAFKLMNLCRVFKDRYDIRNGQEKQNPDGAWFKPWLDAVAEEETTTVDTTTATKLDVDESGDLQAHRERKERTILCEEIQGSIVKAYPGQSAVEKRAKAEIVEKCFGTTSWTAVESMGAGRLREGLAKLREITKNITPAPVKAGKEE